MPPAITLLSRGLAFIERSFGTTTFTIQGQTATIPGDWSPLGRTEEVVLNGRRITFSETVSARKELFESVPREGLLVTRVEDGAVFRIVGEIQVDDLTYRFALNNRHR